jgi:hypothetical protein
MLTPVMAQDSLRGLAPADEYFGHYNLSVLGIANTIRDAGARVDSNADPHSMLSGPLSYVTDSMKDWEQKYPADPWIAKDLLALEALYLRVPTDDGFRLASQTEAWLIADYPNTEYANQGREQLAENRIPYMPQQQPQQAYQPPSQPQPVYQSQPVYQPQPSYQPVYVPVPVYQPVYQPVVVQPRQQAIPSYATPWDRFTAMRVPVRYRY